MKNIKPNKLLVVDLEACCWEEKLPSGEVVKEPPTGERNDIIEIGYALIDLEKRKIIKNDEILINPRSEVSEFCTALTTLTKEQLSSDGERFERAIKKLYKMGFQNIPWGGWGAYDYSALKRECEFYGSKFPLSEEYINISLMYRMWRGTLKKFSQKKALSQLNIEMEGTHHRGKWDAFNAAKIYLRMLSEKN